MNPAPRMSIASLGGHFGVGPSVEYDAVFTTPYDQNGLVASLRLVWYGGP